MTLLSTAREIGVLLGAALTITAGPGQAQVPAATPAGAAAIRALDRAQIDALLASPQDVLVLDVRRPDEVSTIGGFPAFLSIQSVDLERRIASVPRDRQIITVSNHAHRALQAGALLASKGFRVAGAAGVQDYEAQGGTLTGKKVVAAAPSASAPHPAN